MRRLALLLALVLLAPAPSSLRPAPATAGDFERPSMTADYIPYRRERKRQMARYSERHYGRREYLLTRTKVIVLHFTATSTYQPVWNHFASNSPSRGELPGVCTQFVIDKDGTIYKLVRTYIRCRHAIGLNHRSLGIEMVQETGEGSHWAAQQILNRRRQIRAALRLTRYLRQRFDIGMRDVIGHAMSNNSRYFRDLQGWRNDHTDWLWRDVKQFRRKLRAIS
ncbi:MAG TPA: peptidoglycan recognition family protein [Actinomycetota bacterium]|nr:peptidoglycan recognition family protein [Actinomycetota bacterium]